MLSRGSSFRQATELNAQVTPTSFADVSAVVETKPGEYAIDIHPSWSVGGKPNGGYLLAMLARASVDASHHPHVIAASAHYVKSPLAGPAVIKTELLRNGRGAGQVRAWLEQDDELRAMALITTGELTDTEPFWSAGVPPIPTSSFDDSFRVPPVTPLGTDVEVMGEVDLRLDPSVLSFALSEPSGSGVLHGWLQLERGEPFDPFSLLFAVDSLPPASYEVAVTGWVPTFELTAYVRALPAPGPLQILQRAHLIEGQRMDEVCFVWDSRGRLVAQATQLAGIRLG